MHDGSFMKSAAHYNFQRISQSASQKAKSDWAKTIWPDEFSSFHVLRRQESEITFATNQIVT